MDFCPVRGANCMRRNEGNISLAKIYCFSLPRRERQIDRQTDRDNEINTGKDRQKNISIDRQTDINLRGQRPRLVPVETERLE